VSYCGMWQDSASQSALVEPVATDPAYRKIGLGKAAVLEAVRRCGTLGAKITNGGISYDHINRYIPAFLNLPQKADGVHVTHDAPISYTYPNHESVIKNLIRVAGKKICISVYSRLAWAWAWAKITLWQSRTYRWKVLHSPYRRAFCVCRYNGYGFNFVSCCLFVNVVSLSASGHCFDGTQIQIYL